MLIGISGGIGSGKSVVSRILLCMGYHVYDSDLQAKLIMDSSERLKKLLRERIHPDAVDNSFRIDRRLIASIVFSDKDKLNILNQIVHTEVLNDLKSWKRKWNNSKPAFVECAIIHTSGIAGLCDKVWEVVAPSDVRVSRIMSRNGLSAEEALKRIDAQKKEWELRTADHFLIENDGFHPLLPQIESLLDTI